MCAYCMYMHTCRTCGQHQRTSHLLHSLEEEVEEDSCKSGRCTHIGQKSVQNHLKCVVALDTLHKVLNSGK